MMQEFDSKQYYYHHQGFFQNNHAMALEMLRHSHSLLSSYQGKGYHLVDLYGGVGTFGIYNSDLFEKVTVIESVKESIDAAEKNIKANKTFNVTSKLLDCRHLRRLEFPEKLVVITDPPRSGMHPDTIAQLNRLKPEKIIYISCNLEQLQKDILKFKDHKVASAALFDLFPQTTHADGMVELIT